MGDSIRPTPLADDDIENELMLGNYTLARNVKLAGTTHTAPSSIATPAPDAMLNLNNLNLRLNGGGPQGQTEEETGGEDDRPPENLRRVVSWPDAPNICCYRCMCPPCAVSGHEGISAPFCMASILGPMYTMLCWRPRYKTGKNDEFTPDGCLFPSYPDGDAWKCCCPQCAVCGHEGCACSTCTTILLGPLGCVYTMNFWRPKDYPTNEEQLPLAEAPVQQRPE